MVACTALCGLVSLIDGSLEFSLLISTTTFSDAKVCLLELGYLRYSKRVVDQLH